MPPTGDHFDRSHRRDCRLVARTVRGGPAVGWVALTAYSARRVYSGVAWESVYVAADQRGRGVGRTLLEALIPASEAAGFWTLLAGVMVENEASLALHERCGFERVGVMRSMGRDGTGLWRDVVLMQRRSQVDRDLTELTRPGRAMRPPSPLPFSSLKIIRFGW